MGIGNAAESLGPAPADAAPFARSAGCAPPAAKTGGDERRIQLKAFELWNRLLDGGALPSIADFEPDQHPSLSPFGVLLDFTSQSGVPAITFLGESLAIECGISLSEVDDVSDLPDRSLLARIAEHYLDLLGSPAPIGFDAECINQRGRTILYRGILLPFTRSRMRIDYVFGVISWKESASAVLVDPSHTADDRSVLFGSDGSLGSGGNPPWAADGVKPAAPNAAALEAPVQIATSEAHHGAAIARLGALLEPEPESLACHP